VPETVSLAYYCIISVKPARGKARQEYLPRPQSQYDPQSSCKSNLPSGFLRYYSPPSGRRKCPFILFTKFIAFGTSSFICNSLTIHIKTDSRICLFLRVSILVTCRYRRNDATITHLVLMLRMELRYAQP